MKTRAKDPKLDALQEEAEHLPDCSARDAILEQVALRAEALGDLDAAFSARLSVLTSLTSHNAPKFDTLFLNMAWCLAVSDKDPQRFRQSSLLWVYKWVVLEAPRYASVSKRVCERLIDDLEQRYRSNAWGMRGVAHKRWELLLSLGEIALARQAFDAWRSIPRDSGADCMACETSSVAEFNVDLGNDSEGVSAAKRIIDGRLSCASVPHSTFGSLLAPLLRLDRAKLAHDLYTRGRRLLAADEANRHLADRYFLYACARGHHEDAESLLNMLATVLATKRDDAGRCLILTSIGAGLRILDARGVSDIGLDVPVLGVRLHEVGAEALAERCLSQAKLHAHALDARNGNSRQAEHLDTTVRFWTEHAGQ